MKNIFLLAFLSLTVLFTSCNKDDAPDDSQTELNESLISGEWSLTTIEGDGKLTLTLEGTPINVDYTILGKDIETQVTFLDDTEPNTFKSMGGYTSVVTTNILGQTETVEERIPDFLGVGEWRLEGNMLLTKSEGVEQAIEITSFTTDTMTLELNGEALLAGLEDSFTELFAITDITYTGNLVVIMSKN